MNINERVSALRKLMKEHNLKAYIIPSSDPHMSEYVAQRWQSRKWISGFTGSAGTAVILADKAGLWTDGRYFIQAEKELDGSGIDLFKMREPGVPTYIKWINDELDKGDRVGFDGKTFSMMDVENVEKAWKEKELELAGGFDLIDDIWQDRPAFPKEKAFLHQLKFAGKSTAKKLEAVQVKMKEAKVDYQLLSSLDEIAWLMNMRGDDIAYSPVVIAYALISQTKANLFVDESKIPEELRIELEKAEVSIHDYDEVYTSLKNISETAKVQYNSSRVSKSVFDALPEKCTKIKKRDITTNMKACKNDVEQLNLKEACRRDCVALVKWMHWLEIEKKEKILTEVDASNKLEEFRFMGENLVALSFHPISGYQANGAMMHYRAEKDNAAKLGNEGFYLIDSGGNYLDGTTDITRTWAMGELSEQQKRDFTLVLQGVIDLSMAKFLKGTSGVHLDILARRPVWNVGIDYKCGTGHGVGFFLNVHEGPQNFSQHLIDTPFEPGMITTVEPGVYLEGKYGIRTENMLLTVKDSETEFGTWYKFETITFCPIDIRAIIPKMLTTEQKEWLNNYHERTYELLSPSLSQAEKQWLKEMTQKI